MAATGTTLGIDWLTQVRNPEAWAAHGIVPPRIRPRAGGLGETTFIALLAIYLLSYHTMITEYVPISNYPIKALVPLILLFGYRRLPLRGVGLTLVVLFHLFFLLFFVVTLACRPETWVVIDFFKHYMRMAILPVLLLVLPANEFSDRIIKFPLWMGVLFAIQGTLLWVLLYTGNAPDPEPLRFARLREDWPATAYGIFGFGFDLRYLGGTPVVRAQSIFIEPSKFAMFLEYCIFVGYGYWKLERSRLYLATTVLFVVAYLLGQSTAGNVAMLATLLFFLVRQRTEPLPPPIRLVFAVASCLLIAYLTTVFIEFLNEMYRVANGRGDVAGMVLGKSPSGVIQRKELLRYYWGLIVEYPFGRGAEVKHEHAFAPLYWMRRTGLLGLAILLTIQMTAYIKAIDPWLGGKPTIARYVALAYIAQTVHHCSYGDWMDAQYLFMIALLVTLMDMARRALHSGYRG